MEEKEMNILNMLKELVLTEIQKITKKGDLTSAELENAEKAICLIEKIGNIEKGPGYSEAMYPTHMIDPNMMYDNMPGNMSGNSYARGRSPVTGRYISRGMNGSYGPYDSTSMGRGYSGHSINDRMIAKLEEMYDEAKTEHERDMVNMWIKRLEAER